MAILMLIALEQAWDWIYLKYIAAFFVGLLAGGINTLAGNGSAITLPMLMFLGLGADVANGTNRVGVILASLSGTATFKRSGLLDTRGIAYWLIVPASVGSAIGAIVAAGLGAQQMKAVVAVVMVFMLMTILANPKRWIKQDAGNLPNHRKLSTVLVFFAIGLYGGFIQAGVGMLLLSALVLRAGYSLTRANPIKVLVVLALTVPALAVFINHGQVQWSIGLLVGGGQIIGAYLAAKFAAGYPQANIWIRRLLVVVIVVELIVLSYQFAFVGTPMGVSG